MATDGGHPSGGFTLVEMSVVLIIVGLIMLTVLPALSALRTSSQRSTTQTNLQALMQATAAFVQANGCLPCPTPAGTTGSGFGQVGGISGTLTSSCVNCPAPEGIPPFMALGIPAATAHDGWGHWVTMHVDPALTNPANVVVPPTVPVACTCAPSGANACKGTPAICSCPPPIEGACAAPFNASVQGLCAAGLPTAARVIVQTRGGASQYAAVIFVSHGASGLGSYYAQAVTANGFNGKRPGTPPGPCTTGGGYALCNADGDQNFVDAPAVASGPNAYDDVLAYADRNTLVSMLGNGSCQTVW